MPHPDKPEHKQDRCCEPSATDQRGHCDPGRSKSATATALRAVVARIEARQGLDPARRLSRGNHSPLRKAETEGLIPLGNGSLPLDRCLGGGLRRGALHEIVATHKQDEGAAAGFATALAARCADSGPLVWIVEDCAARETGSPYRPGLAGHGFDPERLMLVRTSDARATLWAFEEALRLKAPVVLAELWGAKHYGLAPSRRLLLAAQASRGTALLLHAGLAGKAETLSSAAETRFSVASHPSHRLPSAGNRMPIPGTATFAAKVLKLRLGTQTGFDRDRNHPLVWNPAQRCFDDHPVSVGFPSHPADRPYRAATPSREPIGVRPQAAVG